MVGARLLLKSQYIYINPKNKKNMKKLLLLVIMLGMSIITFGQTKKDGTPDMRYKANKETYGSSYSSPYYESPKKKNNDNGGQPYIQDGYLKKNGTYVEPHVKTKPDDKKWNNYNELHKPKKRIDYGSNPDSR